MPENTPNQTHGLLDSLAAFATTLLGIIYTRLELLSTDIEEEREHIASLAKLSLIALFCFMLGSVLIAVLLIVALWDSYRLLAIGALAAFFILSGCIAWYLAKRKAQAKPRLFSSSLSELRKDREKIEMP